MAKNNLKVKAVFTADDKVTGPVRKMARSVGRSLKGLNRLGGMSTPAEVHIKVEAADGTSATVSKVKTRTPNQKLAVTNDGRRYSVGGLYGLA